MSKLTTPRAHTAPSHCPVTNAPGLRLMHLRGAACACVWLALTGLALSDSYAKADESSDAARRLINGYPGLVRAVENNTVTFWDGSTLPFDDGTGAKSFADWLARPDIADMFAKPYPKGPLDRPPGPEDDPGRARNDAFFRKIYGDCHKGAAALDLVEVVWLAEKRRQVLEVTARNGMAARLRAVSAELDRLPARFDADLATPASTYNCRVIAGTARASAHGFGLAIDLAVKPSGYWRWAEKRAQDVNHSRDLPAEIVDVFERHGFIWGGKWRHFDTMHFEYRPEINPPTVDLPDAPPPADAAKPPGTAPP